MKKHIMNALLVFCMAFGASLGTVQVNAAENVSQSNKIVSNTDLSGLMNMTVIDQKGKSVKLLDLVEKNKVTQLNFWGTFCGPCTKEMPILEKLSKKYEKEGFGVIGLCVDVVDKKGKIDEDEKELAEEIIEDTGVTYPIVFPKPEAKESLNIVSFPTTYFVDSKGNALKDGIFGARDSATWEKEIKSALEQVK